MLGWFSAEAAFASRWKRARACGSLATSSGRNFRATKRSELYVLGFVDDTHAAAAEFLDDAIVRDRLADHEWRKNSGAILGSSSGEVNLDWELAFLRKVVGEKSPSLTMSRCRAVLETRRARLRICRVSFMQTCVNLESFAALGSGLCQHCSYLRSRSRQPLMRPIEIPENRAG